MYESIHLRQDHCVRFAIGHHLRQSHEHVVRQLRADSFLGSQVFEHLGRLLALRAHVAVEREDVVEQVRVFLVDWVFLVWIQLFEVFEKLLLTLHLIRNTCLRYVLRIQWIIQQLRNAWIKDRCDTLLEHSHRIRIE